LNFMIQHGEYTIENQGNIIRFTIRGLFNEYSIRNYARDLKEEISRRTAPFGLLEIASEYEGATPEAFEESNRFNVWLNSSLCAGKAIVLQNNFLYQISESNQKALKEQNVRVFEDETSARNWLLSLLQ